MDVSLEKVFTFYAVLMMQNIFEVGPRSVVLCVS